MGLVSKYKNLSETAKAAIWYTFCNFFNKGISLLTTPIFTRILTTEQYGTFTVYRSWFDIIFIFTSLNIFLGGYTKGLLKFKKDRKAFISSQISLTLTITLIFAVIFALFHESISMMMGLSPVLLIAMFIELISMPVREFWMSKNRMDNKYKSVVIFSIVSNLVGLGASIIAVLCFDFKTEAKIFSDVIIKLLFSAPIFILLMRQGKKIFNKTYWSYALKFNIPLIPHYLSNYVLGQSDRIMIDKMVGKTQAAFYGVSYTISTILNLLVTAINSALLPVIYKSMEVKDYRRIDKSVTPSMLIIFFMTIVVMMFAPEVVRVFAGEQYLDAIYIIPPVTASVFFYFVYLMFSTIEYYYQKTLRISVATMISAALNIALNFIFIPIFGYYAAGYTTLASYILLSIMHYIFYRRILLQEDIAKIYNVKAVLVCSISLIAVMLLAVMIYDSYVIRYSVLGVILILCVIFRKKIAYNVKNILSKKEK